MAHSSAKLARRLILYCSIAVSALQPTYARADDAAPTTIKPDSPATVERTIPRPLPSHPGNVFLAGEAVAIPLPENLTGTAATWRLTDDRGKELGTGTCPVPTRAKFWLPMGRLDIGWYRVDFSNAAGAPVGWTTAAVLAPLAAPTPQDSPVAVDMATTWFARARGPNPAEPVRDYSQFAMLAGANWVRDRLTWGELEPKPGQFAPPTDYDRAAAAQTEGGLHVLQTLHSTPDWATDKSLDGPKAQSRLPRDLAAFYAFSKAMAQRFRGNVRAWEPWNEANITNFGGHTTTEMSSFQKAAYLGYKAGDPQVTVCWNVFAGAGTEAQTENVMANETWPYFDTYNIHTYDPAARYERIFATARDAASGRPIWLSESGQYMRTDSPAPWGDLSQEQDIKVAQFVAASYASALFAGVDRHFFFVLGNYIENGHQLGVLRHDLTPRPAYVALAAVGRMLAGAHCLGQVATPTTTVENGTQAYAFAAVPGGVKRDVLVAWSSEDAPWPGTVPTDVIAVVDYLGRDLGKTVPTRLGTAPVFVVLPSGAAAVLGLEPPPTVAAWRDGAPSPVVLQLNEPSSTIDLNADGYVRQPGSESEVQFTLYNFADHAVSGDIAVESLPDGWRLEPTAAAAPAWQVQMNASDRQVLHGKLTIPTSGRSFIDGHAMIKLRGEFGDDGRPVLAFRIVTDLAKVTPAIRHEIRSLGLADGWQDMVAKGSTQTHQAVAPNGMQFDITLGNGEGWAFPVLTLNPDEYPAADIDALTQTIQVLESEGDDETSFSVQFVTESGSNFVIGTPIDSKVRTPQTVVARLKHAWWGVWSPADPNGQLLPANIRKIMVGINGKPGTRIRFVVRDAAWARY